MTAVVFVLGWLLGVICILIVGMVASNRQYARGGQVTSLVLVEDEPPEPESLSRVQGGDPLAITCRACDAPPGVCCAVLRTGTDRLQPHIIRQRDVGRMP